MFAYCNNNPVNYVDNCGQSPDWHPWDAFCEEFGKWVNRIINAYPSEEEHYRRNEKNIEFPDEIDDEFLKGWDDTVSANCHQFTAPNHDNKKYVSPDGKYEVIYDVNGVEVTDPRDVGTYNIISPNADPIGHFIVDVWPWIWYGNSVDDVTTPKDRLLSFVGIYKE